MACLDNTQVNIVYTIQMYHLIGASALWFWLTTLQDQLTISLIYIYLLTYKQQNRH